MNAPRSTSSRRARVVLALSAFVLVVGAWAVPAASATVSSIASPHVEHICRAPRPGYATCTVLRLIGAPPSFTPAGLSPANLVSAYNLPDSTHFTTQTVAIIAAMDDPNAAADLAVYRAQFGLPACTVANGCFKKVNQSGMKSPLPAVDTGWAAEMSIELDAASATCWSCKILLVEAQSATIEDLGTAADTAVRLGAVAVDNGYTAPEFQGEDVGDSHFDHPGVAMTAPAGDGGYGVEWPASAPHVTAVGGTSLTVDGTVPRGWTETVWGTREDSGTGSGCALYEPKPSVQTDAGCHKRTVADVAAVADPNTGIASYDSYSASGWSVEGGTEIGSAMIAAIFAMASVNGAVASPADNPYRGDPAALNDVTTGVNGGCTTAYWCHGEVGYDGPTGLGTPNGIGAFVSPTLETAITPHKGSPGTAVTITGRAFVAGDMIAVRYKTGLTSPANATLCHAVADADGRFSCTATIPVAHAGALGNHRISARDTTNTTLRAAATFKLK